MNEELKLRRRVVKAEKARDEMRQYKPYIARRQKIYTQELVLKYVNDEPTEHVLRAVAKLAALDQLVTDLETDIETGTRAAQKLSEIALQKGAQDG